VTLPDQEARKMAMTGFARNLVITAGAGTGKTSLLVGRLLAALVLQHFDPERILAVTFTENAAAQMQERLLRLLRAVEPWLEGADDLEASDRAVLETLRLGPENLRRVREILERADELPIATFHAWCARFLLENAPALRLPPDLRIGNLDAARRAFDDDFLAFLERETAETAHAALARSDPAELCELAWQLTALPRESFARARQPPVPDRQEIAERLTQLEAQRERWAGASRNWRAAADAVRAAYGALRDGTLPLPPLPDRAPKGGKRELGTASDTATEALEEHLDWLRPWFAADEEGIQKALEFLAPFLDEQMRLRDERGELTFDDLLLRTRRELLEDGELRRRTARGLSAILVDEFQDTDPLQYDVLFLLAGEPDAPQPADAWSLPLRPGTLCIVGDAKQSIYRFRRADIAAFSRAVEHVVGQKGVRLDLTANFRSLAPILDAVNRVCARSLASDPPWQFDYVPVAATRAGGGAECVEILDLGEPDLSADERRRREGRLVVATIARLQDEGFALSDLAVLLRAATDLGWLLRPLRAAGIAYVLEGSTRFYHRHEIVLATALLGAIARPHDRVAVLALLRSAFADASDAQIFAYARAERSFDFRAPDDGDGPVQRCLRRLRELWQAAARAPVDRAVELLLGADELVLGEGAGFEGAQRLANLARLRDKLLQLGPADLQEAADLLAAHTARATDDEESPLFDRGTQAVRLLTIHRAKGLEFEAVVVPDIARDNRPPRSDGRPSAQRAFDSAGRELVGVQLGAMRNVASLAMQASERRHRDAEDRRLFYVAATRACRRLVLLCNTGAKAGWQRDLEAAPLGDVARRRSDAIEDRAPRRAAVLDPAPTQRALARWRELGQRAAALAAKRVAPSRLDDRAPAQLAGHAERDAARALGSAAHRYLALVALDREQPDEDLLRACADPAWAAELRAIAERFHGSALRERCLRARSVQREIAIAYRTDAGEVVGTIDALLEDEDGALTILDFKTDAVAPEECERAAGRHREQLAAYREGIRRARGAGTIACAVHFLRADRTVEL
jgi:ATP-dependent helicase/nuclease subunit A